MSRIERTNDKYNRAFVKELRRADKEAPEHYVRNLKELMDYLDEDQSSAIPKTE
jgi:hypothetical protein